MTNITTPTSAVPAAFPVAPEATSPTAKTRRATVTLFKPSGKYYTSESWRVPYGATQASDMCKSPDFRQINGGAVLVETDAGEEFPENENFGVPHLIFVPTNYQG
jgi:hypothetical protein